MATYSTAQICLNGHVITPDIKDNGTQTYCTKCGKPIISTCPHCSKPIRGLRNDDIYYMLEEYVCPSYCYNCGKPYPWTERILNNATELISLADELDANTKELIKSAIPDLIIDTPSTPVAAAKYSKALSDAGDVLKNSLHNLLVDVLSESAKKILFP